MAYLFVIILVKTPQLLYNFIVVIIYNLSIFLIYPVINVLLSIVGPNKIYSRTIR